MPIKHRVVPECRLVISSFAGRITDEELLTSYRQFLGSTTVDLSYDHLVDLSNTDSDERSPEGLRSLAHLTESLFKKSQAAPKIAVVAPKTLSFGLSRMYGTFASEAVSDFSVFKTKDEAVSWLGVSDPTLTDSDN